MATASRHVAIVCVAGAAGLTVAVTHLLREPVGTHWVLLALLAVVAGIVPFRLPGAFATYSIGEAFTFAALFHYGTAGAVVTAALDSLGIVLRMRSSPQRALFNAAAPAVAMWLAGGLAFDLTGLPLPVAADAGWASWVAALGAAVVYFLTESLLVATAVAGASRRPLLQVWRGFIEPLWSGPAAGVYFAALAVLGTRAAGQWTLVALLPVPAFLYLALRASAQRAADQVQHVETTARMYASTIEAFAAAVDARDHVTHGHVTRVRTMSVALLRALGVDDVPTIQALEAGSLLHDVGKIGIPDEVLNKPGALTPAEFAVMKTHVAIGVDILKAVDFPFPVLPIVQAHHENWDGTGYPAGIAGEAIPLTARVLSVVDCFDALTSDRPYRPALSVDAARAILIERRGTMYDPRVLDTFLTIQPDISSRMDESSR